MLHLYLCEEPLKGYNKKRRVLLKIVDGLLLLYGVSELAPSLVILMMMVTGINYELIHGGHGIHPIKIKALTDHHHHSGISSAETTRGFDPSTWENSNAMTTCTSYYVLVALIDSDLHSFHPPITPSIH